MKGIEKIKMEREDKKMSRNIVLIAFGISGMAALIYEVVWTRPLSLIFGSTVYAVSTMLTAFLAGFALGSYLFRNVADRSRNPLMLFAGLELGIGLYGLIILALFAVLPPIYLSLLYVPGFQFLQFILCFLVLIFPTTLMGAIWPVVNKVYVGTEEVGRDAGVLYSSNSLGSFLGPLSAGFLLIPMLGILKTCMFAAFLNLFVAAIIVAIVFLRGEKKRR